MPKIMRALTKMKAPMQLPITVLMEIDCEAAPDICVEEEEGIAVAMTVKTAAVGVGPADALESVSKPVAITAALLATTIPEIPVSEGKPIGSVLFARYRPSLTNMMKRRSGLKVGKFQGRTRL